MIFDQLTLETRFLDDNALHPDAYCPSGPQLLLFPAVINISVFKK